MKILGIIPSRYASTRFPGKPLAMIHGKSMIRRVFEQAKKSVLLSDLVVATDDQRIFDHVNGFGGKAIMTSTSHPSGTDRCAEVLRQNQQAEVVINIQGDEPYIQPQQIDLLAGCFKDNTIGIATLVKKITSREELVNKNIPKVTRNHVGRALYFSRHPIPWCREEELTEWISKGVFFKHIGIYGYRSEVLTELAQLKPGNLENCESLEQLRWLENGYQIFTAISDHENASVDSPEDIIEIEKRFSGSL